MKGGGICHGGVRSALDLGVNFRKEVTIIRVRIKTLLRPGDLPYSNPLGLLFRHELTDLTTAV